jgi:hypothetical protein
MQVPIPAINRFGITTKIDPCTPESGMFTEIIQM